MSRRALSIVAPIAVILVVAVVLLLAVTRGLLGQQTAEGAGSTPLTVVSFADSEQWSGGVHVRIPGTDRDGLQLYSYDARASSADLVGHWDLSSHDSARSALRIKLWVSDPASFDNKLWASRIDLVNRFPLQDASIAWLDRANKPGWNDILVPLYDMGQVGQPTFSDIIGVRVTVYSQQGTFVTVDFAGVDLVAL